jgi:transcriptional regulator with XRE-family HTH domain
MTLVGPTLVKEARRTAGLTQAELADRIGVSQSEVARLEKQGANPRLMTLLAAIEAAGYTIEVHLEPRKLNFDETLIAANMRLSPAERLRRFSADYHSIRELAPTRRQKRDGSEGQIPS